MTPINVNDKTHHVQSDPEKPLLWVLRDELGLKGTKYGCGVGVCGACLVLLDGEPNHACMVPLHAVGARRVTTIEGLAQDHPLIRAWCAEQTPQCGYCQPAQVLAATALLEKTPTPVTDTSGYAALTRPTYLSKCTVVEQELMLRLFPHAMHLNPRQFCRSG